MVESAAGTVGALVVFTVARKLAARVVYAAINAALERRRRLR